MPWYDDPIPTNTQLQQRLEQMGVLTRGDTGGVPLSDHLRDQPAPRPTTTTPRVPVSDHLRDTYTPPVVVQPYTPPVVYTPRPSLSDQVRSQYVPPQAPRVQQGPVTEQIAEQQNPWAAVLNRLRPALGMEQPETTLRFGLEQPRQQGGLQFTTQPLNQGIATTQLQQELGLAPPQQQPIDLTRPTTRRGAPAQPKYVPTAQTYDTAQAKKIEDAKTWYRLSKALGYPDLKPDTYDQNDILRENVKALWTAAESRIKEDWSDTLKSSDKSIFRQIVDEGSDAFRVGQGNYFDPTKGVQQYTSEADKARGINQKIYQRAMELQQKYYQMRMASGEAIDLRDPRHQVSLQPFIAEAERELGYTTVQPSQSGLGAGFSVAQGLAQNLGQVPVLGVASNIIGNTTQTVLEGLQLIPRTVTQYPAQVREEGMPIKGVRSTDKQDEYLSLGEIAGAMTEAAMHPGDWWTSPASWGYNNNPIFLYNVAVDDQIQRILNTVYEIPGQPHPGDYYKDYSVFLADPTTRAIGAATLDFSGPTAREQYNDLILNREERLAEMIKQRNAAKEASENPNLPKDVRDQQAFVEAQTNEQIVMLQNADAQELANSVVYPVRDALLSTVTDFTLWWGLLKHPLGIDSITPAARRLSSTMRAADATGEAVASKVAEAIAEGGERGIVSRSLWQGGLAATHYETGRAKTLLTHMLTQVSKKEDIATILDYMVGNTKEFFEKGIPAKILKSESLQRLKNAEGYIKNPIVQVQDKDYRYLAASLHELQGEFATMPSLLRKDATIADVVDDIVGAVDVQSSIRYKTATITRPIPVGTVEAKLSTKANGYGDMIHTVEYLDKDGTVLKRYPAVSEKWAQKEIAAATKAIKTGVYKTRNWYVDLGKTMQSWFSVPVMTLWPGSWQNNAIGMNLTALSNGVNTLEPVDNILTKAEKAFVSAPYEYLERGSTGQRIEGAAYQKGFLKKLREIRGGHTEISLPGGRRLAYGENAGKTKVYGKSVDDALRLQTDSAWRHTIEPALVAAGVPEPALRVVRSGLDKLARDWDIKAFDDLMTDYVTGNARTLDIASAGKQYEQVLSPTARAAIDDITRAAKTPEDLITGVNGIIDDEIASLSKTAGYTPGAATTPIDIAGETADILRSLEISRENLIKNGLPTNDIGSIERAIGNIRDQLKRTWQVVARARTPEAVQHFTAYYNDLAVLRRDVEEGLSRVLRETKLIGTPEAWRDYNLLKQEMWKQYGEASLVYAQEHLQHAIEGAAIPTKTPLPIQDVSGYQPIYLRDRGWVFEHQDEAEIFSRQAAQQHWDAFMQRSERSGDLRSMDIMLQTQQDITRETYRVNAEIEAARKQYLLNRGEVAGTPKYKKENAKFYTYKTKAEYELMTFRDAKIKAATSYLEGLPEPVTYRHAQHGIVTIIGVSPDGIAIRLSNGQVATLARDAVLPETLRLAEQRLQAIKAAANKPPDIPMPGLHPDYNADVDKLVPQFYQDLMTSRNNMYTAMPTINDMVGDKLLLHAGLRSKVEALAKKAFEEGGRKLTPAQAAGVLDAATHVRSKWRQWLEAGSEYGNKMASYVMIDNSNMYRIDEALVPWIPYHIWPTRTGKNLREALITNPMLRHAFDIQDALFEEYNGDAGNQYVEFEIGGQSVPLYLSLGKYLTSASDWGADPSYYEKRRIDGPMGPFYAVASATSTRLYPWYDFIDNQIRKFQGKDPVDNGGMLNSLPQLGLALRAAEYAGGSSIIPILSKMGLLSERDRNAIVGALSSKAEAKKITGIDAGYALGIFNNLLDGKPLPEGMTASQKQDAERLLSDTISELGRNGLIASFTALVGATAAPQLQGKKELREAQQLYQDVGYPENQFGGRGAQAYVKGQHPGVEVYWMRYNLADPTAENPAVAARYQEMQEQRDKIYDQMSEAVTRFIIDNSGRVAPYQGVKEVKQKYYDQVEALEKQYADVMEREFHAPNVTKMNPHERAVYELENILRYNKDRPPTPTEGMTPEEQVDGWNAIDKWERAKLDYIENTIEAINSSYSESGDPPKDLWIQEIQKLTNGQYASELVRKYISLKYADRVEKQWSTFGAFEKEMDDAKYQEREDNVRALLGDSAVRDFQIYNRVKPENKEKYREEHPNTALAIVAAYNPEAWKAGITMFGKDTWQIYKAYKAQQPDYPGENASETALQAYYAKLDALRKKYPQAEEIAFWVDGRYRWWYDARTQVPDTTREGKFGGDYDEAIKLFGENIFDVVRAFPSGGSKKDIAIFYDNHPEYAAFRAWQKQYKDMENLTLADLQTLNLEALPKEQPINASFPPFWTQFATSQLSRPLGSGREVINETPEQKKQRLVDEAKFTAAKVAEQRKLDELRKQGAAATIDSTSYKDELDDEYASRYGRNRGYSRRYYGGGRRSYRSSGDGYSSGGGSGGGGGGYYPTAGTSGEISQALWRQSQREVTPLNQGGFNGNLWGSLLERLRRPGR